MKNLPDEFPIRYALIAKWNDSVQQPLDKMLYNQLIVLLESKPLLRENLDLYAQMVSFSLLGTNVLAFAKLFDSVDIAVYKIHEWVQLAGKSMASLIPKIKIEDLPGILEISGLGLYSYMGACEIPCFFQAKNATVEKLKEKFGYIIDSKSIKDIFDIYTGICKGVANQREIWEIGNKYKKPLQISVPFSAVWGSLDNNNGGGCIPVSGFFDTSRLDDSGTVKQPDLYEYRSKLIENIPRTDTKEGRINVLICESWESLMAEEVAMLHKITSFCSNCGKSLPYDYNGKYCPDEEGNEKCIRERNRKRKKKQIVSQK